MIHQQNSKFVQMKTIATVATNATNTGYVDCTGFHYAKVQVLVAPAGASNASQTFTVLSLQEANDTNDSNFADVTGFVGGTNATGGFTIPIVNTSTSGQVIEFNVDCRKRKKVLRVKSTPTAVASNMGAYGVFATLSRTEVTPTVIGEAISGVSTDYIRVIG